MESELLPATRVNHTPATVAPVTPMEMLAMAVQQGADLEKLEKLMGLQERWEANEARKAFVAALSAFKAEAVKVTKNKLVDFTSAKGRTSYKHATLDHICEVLGEVLSRHGLSFRWEIKQEQRVSVTCHLQHVLGHTESVTMTGPADDTGNKNAIQQVGSTVTYLQRYTLLAITGTATGEDDNDGRPPVPDRDQHLKAIKEAQTMESLKNAYATAFNSTKDQHALKDYIAAKDARKAELQKGEAK